MYSHVVFLQVLHVGDQVFPSRSTSHDYGNPCLVARVPVEKLVFFWRFLGVVKSVARNRMRDFHCAHDLYTALLMTSWVLKPWQPLDEFESLALIG